MAESDKIKSSDIIQDDVFASTIKSAKDLLKVLDALEKELIQVADAQAKIAKKSSKELTNVKNIEKANTALKNATQTRKEATAVQKQQAQIQKQLTQLSDEEVKAKLRFQQANKLQRDILKDELILQNQQAGTLVRLNAENRKLRREREGLNLETAKGKKRLDEINKALDLNNKRIVDNSDKLKKQKLNVGNYTESTKEAIRTSGLFSSQLATLERIQATLNLILKKNTVETEANAVAQTTASTASGGFSKALKVLKLALIGTGIGAIVVALGTLITAFATTQRGADAFTKVLRPLTTIFERFLGFIQDTGFAVFDRLKAAFEDPQQAVKDLGKAIQDNLIARFESLALFGPAIAKLFSGKFKEGFTDLSDAAIQLGTGVKDASDKLKEFGSEVGGFVDESISQGEQLDALIKSFERRQIDTVIPLAKARLEFQKLRAIAVDVNKSDEERLEALGKAEEAQRFIADVEKELLDLQIQKIELQQTFNDTSREDELELVNLKADAFAKDEQAQKKINSLVTLRAGILKKIETDRLKSLEEENTSLDDSLEDFENYAEAQEQIFSDLEDAKIQKEIESEEKRQELAKQSLQEEEKIQDAKIANLKQLNDLSKTLAGDNENAQKALLAAQKSIAVSEILINTQREISDIRADQQKTDQQKTTQVTQARVASALSVATVLATNSAYDGVENTGTGGKGDDRGGMLWMLHPEERVMTRKQNIKVGGLSNDELADMAMMYNRGQLINPMTDLALSVTNKQDKQVDKTHLIVSELGRLRYDMNNKPVQQVNVDSFGNLVEVVYRNGVRDTKTYKGKKWL